MNNLVLHHRATLAELRVLADCLAKGMHKLAVASMLPRHFPYGVWRDAYHEPVVLFDRSYRGLWRWRHGVVEPVRPTWQIEYRNEEVLFDELKPQWQQYDAMKQLRAILVAWGYIHDRNVARRHFEPRGSIRLR